MAWPVDGRDRGTPPRSPDARSEDEFVAELVDTVVRANLHMYGGYAFPELTHEQGRLFHGTFLKYFSFFAWKFPSWLMAVASQCPHQDVRRTIIGDCVDEEVGDVDAAGRCHVDVLYDEAEACGVSRDEIAATQPTPIILACVHAFENFTRTLGWEAGLAAMAAIEMGHTPESYALRAQLLEEALSPEQIAAARTTRESKSLAERTGLPEEDLMFAALHSYKDQFHGGAELALLRKYAVTRDLQDRMLWAAQSSVFVFCAMREEMDRLARAAVGLPPGEMVRIGTFAPLSP